MQDGAHDPRACVARLENTGQTNMHSDSKRKASDPFGSESPSKRVKNSHSETITPEAEGKPRVVPFPEKVCRFGLYIGDHEDLTNGDSPPSRRSAMARSNSGSSTTTIAGKVSLF